MKPFSLPTQAHAYIKEITERCEELINLGIWSGIDIQRLRNWRANFKTDEEKYFSTCVLDSLIYRSEKQTVALIAQLFERALPDLARTTKFPTGAGNEIIESLKYNSEPGIRLVSVVQRTDPYTKSASVIGRYMKRFFRVQEQWIIKPWGIKEQVTRGIEVFVFIDDFLGTGDQFGKCIAKEDVAGFFSDACVVYAPLVAHLNGIDYLKNEYPELGLTAVEILDESYGLFSKRSGCFDDGVNSPETARKFYIELLEKNNIASLNPGGFGRLELVYAFQHAAPDNSLPILWWNASNEWSNLFDR